MTPSALLASLTQEEGFRRTPYDDAQPNMPLKGPVTILGTVTFGHGLTWLTEAESRAIVAGRLSALATELAAAFPWFSALSDARQDALIDMRYNLGMAGLESFTVFLGLMAAGKFAEAADDLAMTKWAGQVGNRATKIEFLIRGG